MFWGCFRSVLKGVWNKLYWSFKAAPREFLVGFKKVPGYFKEISTMFQKSFEDVLWICQPCFEELPRCLIGPSGIFRGHFKSVSQVIQESFKRPFKQVFDKTLKLLWGCFKVVLFLASSAQAPASQSPAGGHTPYTQPGIVVLPALTSSFQVRATAAT